MLIYCDLRSAVWNRTIALNQKPWLTWQTDVKKLDQEGNS